MKTMENGITMPILAFLPCADSGKKVAFWERILRKKRVFHKICTKMGAFARGEKGSQRAALLEMQPKYDRGWLLLQERTITCGFSCFLAPEKVRVKTRHFWGFLIKNGDFPAKNGEKRACYG